MSKNSQPSVRFKVRDLIISFTYKPPTPIPNPIPKYLVIQVTNNYCYTNILITLKHYRRFTFNSVFSCQISYYKFHQDSGSSCHFRIIFIFLTVAVASTTNTTHVSKVYLKLSTLITTAEGIRITSDGLLLLNDDSWLCMSLFLRQRHLVVSTTLKLHSSLFLSPLTDTTGHVLGGGYVAVRCKPLS